MEFLNNLARSTENVTWFGDLAARLQDVQRQFRLHSESVDSWARSRARLKDSQGRTFLACARCNGPMKSVSRLSCVVQGRVRYDVGESYSQSWGTESRLISVIEFRTRSRSLRCALQHRELTQKLNISANLYKLWK